MAKKAEAPPEPSVTSLGYPQCEWRVNTERCRFPGSRSSSCTGSGPWYCSGHIGCLDPIVGADIVQASRDYRPITTRQAEEAWLAEAKAARPVAGKPALTGGGLDWARKIVARSEAGESVGIAALRIATAALLQAPSTGRRAA